MDNPVAVAPITEVMAIMDRVDHAAYRRSLQAQVAEVYRAHGIERSPAEIGQAIAAHLKGDSTEGQPVAVAATWHRPATRLAWCRAQRHVKWVQKGLFCALPVMAGLGWLVGGPLWMIVFVLGNLLLGWSTEQPLRRHGRRLGPGEYAMGDVKRWMGHPELRAQLQARLHTDVPLLVGDVEEMEARLIELESEARVSRLQQQTLRFVQRNAKSAYADLTGL
jgi:hypothetical protein